MRVRLFSILLLAFAAGMPPGLLSQGPAAILSVFSVVFFWWAHAFRLQSINWRVLIVFVTFALSTWIFVGGTGVTGISDQYDFDPSQISSLKRSDRIALRLFMNHAPTRDERYLRLGTQAPMPESAGDERSRHWAHTRLRTLPLEQKLNRLEKWFRTSFVYSLDSEWEDLDSFLFDTRRGYCLHFSYAVQTLLRTAGEDAQWAYGYSGGSWNPITRILTFRDSDAHAWLEVLDRKSRSWTRVDPTEWVTTIAPEEATSAREPVLTPSWIRKGLFLLILPLLILGALRDPRRELIGILKTTGPLSLALASLGRRAQRERRRSLALCLERVRKDYEHAYFGRPDRLRNVWRLRLRLFQLRLLGWKYFSRVKRGHE